MKKGIKYLLSCILLLISFSFFGQNKQTDSLLTLLKNEKEDTTKVKTLYALTVKLYNSGRYDTSLVCANNDKALAEKLNYKKGIASAIMSLNLIYYYQGNFSKALEYSFKLQKLEQEMGNKGGIAISYNSIGNVYLDQNKYTKALEYYCKSLKLNQEVGNKNGIANNFGNIGSIYRIQNNYPMALECYKRSFDLHQIVNNKVGMANNLGNIGNTYEAEGNIPKALVYDFKALAIGRENGFKSNIELNLGSIGNIYTKQKNYTQAKIYLDSALTISKDMGEKVDIQTDYMWLSNLDSITGNYKEGLEDYKKYIIYRDSLINEANTKVELNFEYEQKQITEKVELDKKEAIAKQDKKRQLIIRNAFIGGFLLIFIVVLLLFGRFKTKEKTAKLLGEQYNIINERNAELERLSIVARETVNSILIMDADGTLEWVNTSFERLNGMKLNEFKSKHGNTIYELSNNPDIKNIIQNCIATKTPVRYEASNTLEDGRIVWEASTLSPIFDSVGKLTKLIIIDDDITDRKRHEEIIKQKNKDITDSIMYAKRLQQAILPSDAEINKQFPENFILYKPKDIVAGDFYWMHIIQFENEKKENNEDCQIFIAAADCTGHGVPGALVSVVCSNALNRAVKEFGLRDTGKILDKVTQLVLETFEKSGTDVNDGMDISLLSIKYNQKGTSNEIEINWSGANNPLWYFQNPSAGATDKELTEIKPDKQPIGKYDDGKPFTTNKIPYQPDTTFYLFTDGYADQFGGEHGKKFKYKQLEKLLQANSGKSFEEQKYILDKTIEEWKGDLEQVDDICVIGFRV